MINPKLLRQNLEFVIQQLARRGVNFDISHYQILEQRRQQLQQVTQDLQTQSNQQSKFIGQAKAQGKDIQNLLKEVSNLSNQLKQYETDLATAQQDLLNFQLTLPNLLHESVPQGRNEDDNQEIRRVGEARKNQDFKFKDHVELGEQLGLMNFTDSAKLSGARFVVLEDGLAQLHRVLAQFMLNLHTKEHGYKEFYVPYLVHKECLYGTGQLPNLADDQFTIQDDGEDLVLIPTAEVPLVNLLRDRIVPKEQLPLKFVAHTPCFRREAGSYGKDTRGMIRQHQFEKIELVQLVEPSESYKALEQLTNHAEKVLQLLELPYRVMLLCSGDTGFSAAKTYDIEVWLPGQQRYREISSCSNCEDFQTRRIQARWRASLQAKPELLHSLNGSGVAVGRALIAILENYQQADGRIQVPKVLQSEMQTEYITVT